MNIETIYNKIERNFFLIYKKGGYEIKRKKNLGNAITTQ